MKQSNRTMYIFMLNDLRTFFVLLAALHVRTIPLPQRIELVSFHWRVISGQFAPFLVPRVNSG